MTTGPGSPSPAGDPADFTRTIPIAGIPSGARKAVKVVAQLLPYLPEGEPRGLQAAAQPGRGHGIAAGDAEALQRAGGRLPVRNLKRPTWRNWCASISGCKKRPGS